MKYFVSSVNVCTSTILLAFICDISQFCFRKVCKMKIAVILILCLAVCLGGDELYSTLGVRRTATQKEIKQAYKKLAREL